MGSRTLLTILTAVLAAAAMAATTATRPAAQPASSWDSYRIVLTRNIFSRDRSAPSRGHNASSRTTTRSPEQSIVLTGVAVQDAVRVAFFEDTRSGETIMVGVGQMLAGGAIDSITLDSVEYRSGPAAKTIAVGESLTGVPAAPSSMPAASEPATGAATTRPNGASGDSNDILERMRQRRLQETK